MLRALYPVYAVVLPMALGLGLIYLYLDGVIGISTALLTCFVIAAVVITCTALYEDGDEREAFRTSDWRI